MGSFANSLFKIMLGWLQAVVSAVWSAFTSENGSSLFNWIGKNWVLIAGILCFIGLAADLCVYILRWKPFRVWKSFFTGAARQEDEQASGEQVIKCPDRDHIPDPAEYNAASTGHAFKQTLHDEQTPDLSQWEDKSQEEKTPGVPSREEPAMITNAGYVVPADSPYRRPEKKSASDEPVRNESLQTGTDGKTEEGPVSVTPRRRRRISMSELFSDPEEELRPFEAPQHVIDSRKAYRDPVYPRGWNKSEDSGE